jgi:hypothetical protein
MTLTFLFPWCCKLLNVKLRVTNFKIGEFRVIPDERLTGFRGWKDGQLFSLLDE